MQVRKLLTNVFSNYANVAVGGITGLVLTPVLFRYLQPNNYGLLAFALTANAALEAIDLGMASSLTRYVSVYSAQGRTEELRGLVSSAFFLLLGIGITGTVVLVACSPLVARSFHLRTDVSGDAPLVIALIGLSVSVQLPSAALAAHLMGCQDFVYRNATEIFAHLVRFALTIILITTAHGLIVIALVYPFVSLLRFLGLLVAVSRCSSPIVPQLSSIDIRRLHEISRFASLSFIEDTATRYYFLADSLLAARFLALSDLAVLTVCRRLPTGLTNLAQQPLWVAYPLVSSAWSRGDQKALQKYVLVTTRILLACVIPPSAAMFIWAEPILRYWIGPSILTEIPVFRAVVVFGLFASIESGPLTLLYGVGRIGFSTALILILLAALAVAGRWVIPQWGLFGLAALFAGLYGVGGCLLFARAIRLADLRLNHWFIKGVLPALIPSAIAAGWFCIGYMLLGPSLIGLITSVITYVIILYYYIVVTTRAGGTRSLRHRIKYLFMGIDEI